MIWSSSRRARDARGEAVVPPVNQSGWLSYISIALKGTGTRVLDLRVSTPFLLVNASLEESHEYPIAQFNG